MLVKTSLYYERGTHLEMVCHQLVTVQLQPGEEVALGRCSKMVCKVQNRSEQSLLCFDLDDVALYTSERSHY